MAQMHAGYAHGVGIATGNVQSAFDMKAH